MTNIIPINTYQFLEKIYDRKNNPDNWIYLGQLPSVVFFHSPISNFSRELIPGLEIIAKKGRGKYDVFLVDTTKEVELNDLYIDDYIPTIYLCPIYGNPTVLEKDLSIKKIRNLINEIL